MSDKILSPADLAVQVARDSTIITTSTKTTLYGYATAILGFLADYSVAIMVGTVVTILAFLVNFYFQKRRDRRESLIKEENTKREAEKHKWAYEEHRLRMMLLRRQAEESGIVSETE